MPLLEREKENWEVSAVIMAAVLEVLHDSKEGPCTFLIPSAEFVEKTFGEDEDAPETPESLKAQVGLLLDSILLGTLLADGLEEAMAASNGAVELTTLGGTAVTGTVEQGQLVLVDPSGNRITVTGPHARGPRGDVFYKADGFPRGDAWSSYFKSRPGSLQPALRRGRVRRNPRP